MRLEEVKARDSESLSSNESSVFDMGQRQRTPDCAGGARLRGCGGISHSGFGWRLTFGTVAIRRPFWFNRS